MWQRRHRGVATARSSHDGLERALHVPCTCTCAESIGRQAGMHPAHAHAPSHAPCTCTGTGTGTGTGTAHVRCAHAPRTSGCRSTCHAGGGAGGAHGGGGAGGGSHPAASRSSRGALLARRKAALPPRSAAAPSSTDGTVHVASHSQSGAPACSHTQWRMCQRWQRYVVRGSLTTCWRRQHSACAARAAAAACGSTP